MKCPEKFMYQNNVLILHIMTIDVYKMCVHVSYLFKKKKNIFFCRNFTNERRVCVAYYLLACISHTVCMELIFAF